MSEPVVVVCFTRCYPCQFGEHRDPPQPHPWANDDDIQHARATGQPEPTGNCGCYCAQEPS